MDYVLLTGMYQTPFREERTTKPCVRRYRSCQGKEMVFEEKLGPKPKPHTTAHLSPIQCPSGDQFTPKSRIYSQNETNCCYFWREEEKRV